MKRIVYTIILLATSLKLSAQSDTIMHIIERGESIEYLATKYGVTETDIRKWNSNALDLLYTGMEIRILVPKRGAGVAKHSATPYNSYYVSKCKQADNLLNSGEYKKAINAYSELIDSYSSSLACTEAYYGRALAYYNRGKWKSAMTDFEVVLDDTDFSQSARSQCEELLAKAQKNREEQLEQRGQMWAGIIGAAAMTTAAVVSAKNAPSSNNTSNGNISYSNGGSSTYEQRNIQTSNGHSSSNSSSSKLCRTCKGDGKCIGCHGSGYRTDNQFGTGVDYSHQCGVCRGSGKCSVCGGIGYK